MNTHVSKKSLGKIVNPLDQALQRLKTKYTSAAADVYHAKLGGYTQWCVNQIVRPHLPATIINQQQESHSMAYGTTAYGTGTFGGGSPIRATFDLDKPVKDDPIIIVASLFGSELIQHFRDYPDELKKMDRRKFEELVAELFQGFGYDVELTQQTRDGGRDIIAIKRKEMMVKYLIECKRPDAGKVIGVGVVRSLLGVVYNERSTGGILVTTAYFSKPAKLLFEENEWQLQGKDYDALVKWLDEYFKP